MVHVSERARMRPVIAAVNQRNEKHTRLHLFPLSAYPAQIHSHSSRKQNSSRFLFSERKKGTNKQKLNNNRDRSAVYFTFQNFFRSIQFFHVQQMILSMEYNWDFYTDFQFFTGQFSSREKYRKRRRNEAREARGTLRHEEWKTMDG